MGKFIENVKNTGKKTWEFLYDHRGVICAATGYLVGTVAMYMISERERERFDDSDFIPSDPNVEKIWNGYLETIDFGTRNSNTTQFFRSSEGFYDYSDCGKLGEDLAEAHSITYGLDWEDENVRDTMMKSKVKTGILYIEEPLKPKQDDGTDMYGFFDMYDSDDDLCGFFTDDIF